MDTITGCWRGALLNMDGQREMQFALEQPSHTTCDRPILSVDGARRPVRLLDGAERSFVTLADAPDDQRFGSFRQLLMEARVLGDRLVGHWLGRDASGRVVATGLLTGVRG